MSGPSIPKAVRFADLAFEPRFEHGEMAQLAAVCGPEQKTELGVGFARMTNAKIDWTIRYDEVLIVLSGELKVHTKSGTLTAGPRDSIWLPRGTELTYEAEDALVAYAIHPADWAARSG